MYACSLILLPSLALSTTKVVKVHKAIYPGTFDPITLGHQDIIRRGLHLFEHVVVAVADSKSKAPCFSLEERVGLIKQAFKDEPRVDVVSFRGLLVDLAQKYEATVLLRGLRGVADYEYEQQMANMNYHLNEQLETVFLSSRHHRSFVSSTLVREVATMRGDVSALVPTCVAEALAHKFPKA
jgi:pantetheine-phosphate adenylyltransferase